MVRRRDLDGGPAVRPRFRNNYSSPEIRLWQFWPPVTRRALEAAKVTFAIKVDPENFETWKATEVRKSRWEARAQGMGTQRLPLNTQYKGVSGQPIYEDLQTMIAVLSDYTVHFTPEHVHSYQWEQTNHPDGTSSM